MRRWKSMDFFWRFCQHHLLLHVDILNLESTSSALFPRFLLNLLHLVWIHKLTESGTKPMWSKNPANDVFLTSCFFACASFNHRSKTELRADHALAVKAKQIPCDSMRVDRIRWLANSEHRAFSQMYQISCQGKSVILKICWNQPKSFSTETLIVVVWIVYLNAINNFVYDLHGEWLKKTLWIDSISLNSLFVFISTTVCPLSSFRNRCEHFFLLLDSNRQNFAKWNDCSLISRWFAWSHSHLE